MSNQRPTSLADATDDRVRIVDSVNHEYGLIVATMPGGHTTSSPLIGPLWSVKSRAQVLVMLAASVADQGTTWRIDQFEIVVRFLDDYAREHHWGGYCESCHGVAHSCQDSDCGHTPLPECPEYEKYRRGDKARGFGGCGVCHTTHRFYSASKPTTPVRVIPRPIAG